MFYYDDDGRLMYKCGICNKPKFADGEIFYVHQIPEIILEGEIIVCSEKECRLMIPPPYFQLTLVDNHFFDTQLLMHIKPIFRNDMVRIRTPIIYNISRGYFIETDRLNVTKKGFVSDLTLRRSNI
mgnify:FL=1